MALEKILTDGSESGASSAGKINTAFDAVDQNTLALDGSEVINKNTNKTVGVGKDFETLHEALRWIEKVTQTNGIIYLLLDSGTYTLGSGDAGEFNDHRWSYYSLQSKWVEIEPADWDNGICNITIDPFDDLDNHPTMIDLSLGASIGLCRIGFDGGIGGYPYPENATLMYGRNSFIYGSEDTFTNASSFVSGGSTLFELEKSTMDNASFGAVDLDRGSTARLRDGMVFSNCENGLVAESGSNIFLTAPVTFTGNVNDTNIPLNEIQIDGSYISDLSAPLSVAGALLPTGVRTPKGALNLFTPITLGLNDTTYIPLEYDNIVVNRGGVTPNILDGSITIPTTDIYEMDLSIDCDFNQQEQLDIMVFVNGVNVNDNPLALQGKGNGKPNAITWNTTFPFTAGDVVDLRVRNGDTGNVNINFRRLYFSLKLDI